MLQCRSSGWPSLFELVSCRSLCGESWFCSTYGGSDGLASHLLRTDLVVAARTNSQVEVCYLSDWRPTTRLNCLCDVEKWRSEGLRAQKDFADCNVHLNAELARACGHYSVFFDRDAIQHGEQISSTILEHAKTCKLAVVVVSEEYFTRSRPPMTELAASYTAAKDGNGVPCIFPVFLALRPEDAKDYRMQLEWGRTWQKWEVNEKMSERRKNRASRIQPTVWKEAVERLLDIRGPIYKPHENEYDPEIFLKKVAQVIARKLNVLNRNLQQDEVEDQVTQQDKKVDLSEDTGVDLGKNYTTTGSASSPVAGKMADEKEVLPEPDRSYRVVVCLEFGTMSSMFAYAHIAGSDDIWVHYDYPRPTEPSCRTVTGIYYYPRDGSQSYRVKTWGNSARYEHERDAIRARSSSEHTVGIYVTRFNPHLTSRDMQMSSGEPLPHGLSVDRVITDYLHEMGAYILEQLQERFGHELTMKMIQWCVPVPSSWGNAAKGKMKACMEAAGLVNGADGSPHPVKMVLALEAACFHSLRTCSSVQWEVGDKVLAVDIGEETFNTVVHEVVSLCKHIYRVEEVGSSLCTRCSSLDSKKFLELLHRKIGPCFQEFVTRYPIERSCKPFIQRWDLLKLEFGAGRKIAENVDIVLPPRLAHMWEGYDHQMGNPEREAYDEIEISYLEIQALFDPVIDEILDGIYKQYDQVRGVRALVLVGDSLAGSTYVMGNIKQRLSRVVPEISSPLNPESAACQGTVALAIDLCNGAGSKS